MSKKIILYIIVEKWIRSANVYATGGGQRGKVLNSIFKSLKFSFSYFPAANMNVLIGKERKLLIISIGDFFSIFLVIYPFALNHAFSKRQGHM